MAKWVIKRGGKKEPFRLSKVSGAVRAACSDVRLPAKRTKTVVNKVTRDVIKFAAKRKITVRTSDLRKISLKALGEIEPKAARAWRKYDAARRAKRAKAKRRRT
ncbi:MAG TPA: ATP cone domain-containing protein [Candidatus Paceibacterota bacterium]|nr:ATP cone domain-containing protein [Candidatus Paceibacterota bacterium]